MKTLLPLTFLLLLTPSAALGATPKLGGHLVADFSAGADQLLALTYSDGTSQDIEAGNGVAISISAGLLFFQPNEHRLELLANLGIKYSSMQPTENADLSYVRWPLELLAFYRNDDLHLRIGGGLAYHVGNSLKGSGPISDLDVSLDPALGYVLQGDAVFDVFTAGLRYTRISYAPEGMQLDIAAHSVGVQIGLLYALD